MARTVDAIVQQQLGAYIVQLAQHASALETEREAHAETKGLHMGLMDLYNDAVRERDQLRAEIATLRASMNRIPEETRMQADSELCQASYFNKPAPQSFERALCPGWPMRTLTLGADADNAPYGVTLAGWSPQDHQGLNLLLPASAKYLVFSYLAINHIMPAVGWAPQAVKDLQAVQPSVPWVATDDETLGYGDEFVHLADNGHGMPAGSFNPSACAKEFFWGSMPN